jgi:thiamine-phosphate pyrophosphorylase
MRGRRSWRVRDDSVCQISRRWVAAGNPVLALSKLYAITDVRLSGLSHARQVALLTQGGAKLIQLREKRLAPLEFFEQAKDAIQIARQRGAKLIINDRVDIAMALGADGVHLGQDDLPPHEARRLMGAQVIIGFSTHTLKQAKEATALPIDYLAIGPIFPTSSKTSHDPVVGLERLQLIRKATQPLPLVAIGGINHDNAVSVLRAGADCVAVINSLLSEPLEIPGQTATFLSKLGKNEATAFE